MVFMIEIKFTCEKVSHSGYCSDPCDISTNTIENIIEHREITMSSDEIKENFDEYGNFIGYLSEFNYTKRCNIGSGYCGLDNKYYATSAKIVESSTLMNKCLDEIDNKKKKLTHKQRNALKKK